MKNQPVDREIHNEALRLLSAAVNERDQLRMGKAAESPDDTEVLYQLGTRLHEEGTRSLTIHLAGGGTTATVTIEPGAAPPVDEVESTYGPGPEMSARETLDLVSNALANFYEHDTVRAEPCLAEIRELLGTLTAEDVNPCPECRAVGPHKLRCGQREDLQPMLLVTSTEDARSLAGEYKAKLVEEVPRPSKATPVDADVRTIPVTEWAALMLLARRASEYHRECGHDSGNPRSAQCDSICEAWKAWKVAAGFGPRPGSEGPKRQLSPRVTAAEVEQVADAHTLAREVGDELAAVRARFGL